jgi:cytochrome c
MIGRFTVVANELFVTVKTGRAIMPFKFGGAITSEEAWDLAAFIDDQCRPGKEGCALKSPNCVDGKDQVNLMGIR